MIHTPPADEGHDEMIEICGDRGLTDGEHNHAEAPNRKQHECSNLQSADFRSRSPATEDQRSN